MPVDALPADTFDAAPVAPLAEPPVEALEAPPADDAPVAPLDGMPPP
jgi:hypothetical protein